MTTWCQRCESYCDPKCGEQPCDLHGHCPRCAEQLAVAGYPVALCRVCNGLGEVISPWYAWLSPYDEDCPSCSGDCIDPDTGWDSMSAAWCEYLTYLPSA
jgi:hypothetical protein